VKKSLCSAAAGLLIFAAVVSAADYPYVSPDTLRERLVTGKKTIIVDIRAPAEFAEHHIEGAIATNAYPVKSDGERKRLDTVLGTINASQDDVVIVCPRGGGGAKNTYDYLKAKGVDEKRLFILAKGMEGWPYPELCRPGH